MQDAHLSSMPNTLSVSSVIQAIKPTHVPEAAPTSRFVLQVSLEQCRIITTLPKSYLLQETFISLQGSRLCSGFYPCSQEASPVL